jgi:pimeloyl-ACP methyl ester carboxylesterase
MPIKKMCRDKVIRCITIAVLLAASACATPIGTRHIEPRAAQNALTQNALTGDKPSSFSAREILNLSLNDKFEKNPKEALAELHANLAPTGDENRIFALAELSFLQAERSGDRSYYLAAAAYAYSFLLPGAQGTPPKAIDPRGRWAVDIYNRSVARGLMGDDQDHVALRGGQFDLPFGTLTVAFDERALNWAGFRLKDFRSASELKIRGLHNRYREPGVGAPLVASLEPIEAAAAVQYRRIPKTMKIPVSAFLRFENPRAALASGTLSARLEVYNPDSSRTVKIGSFDVPIEYETTSALADSLEGAPVWDTEIAGFRSPNVKLLRESGAGDGLFMYGPHRRGHIPIVLVHGTASSPARWADMVNEIANDPRLFNTYELWLFMYATGNPIAYSAKLFRDALGRTVSELDPEGSDPGLKRLVVIGHSQGGLLTKMTVIDSGMRLWPFKVPPEKLDVKPDIRELLTQSLILRPLPFVKRVIFISTPHRGSYQALGVLGSLASWFVNMPGHFAAMSVDLLRLQKEGVLLGPMSGIPTSITNMNPSNRFVQSLAATPIAEGVIAHSIIAVDSDKPLEEAGDGVVKYSSAHIDGVESEKIIRSGHSVQGNPAAIQEVKRILQEHLNTPNVVTATERKQ